MRIFYIILILLFISCSNNDQKIKVKKKRGCVTTAPSKSPNGALKYIECGKFRR